jgi:serine/threonine protein kinase
LLNGTNEKEQMELIIEHIGVWPSSHSNKDLAYPGLSVMKLPNKSPRKLLDLFQESLSFEGLRLLTSLLDYHPHQRWTAAQALASPFFQEVDPPKPLRHEAMPRFRTFTTRSTKA